MEYRGGLGVFEIADYVVFIICLTGHLFRSCEYNVVELPENKA